MTSKDFASLGSGAFNRLARARQALVAATAAVMAEMDADTCDRRCACERKPLYDAAIKVESDAYYAVRTEEASWAEFCAIRREDVAHGR